MKLKDLREFKREKDGTLLIDKTRTFELLATLIKDGILPFVPKPIDKEDIVDRKCDFELRDYQKEAWNEFKKYSNIGIFFPPSTGKTYEGIYAMTHLKGPHLVLVPTRTLIEQWKERIDLYTDLEPEEYDVVTYYTGIKKEKKYNLKIIDECHHLPSNEFSKIAMIKTRYTMGLSATPQREDSREEYIFALTGKPYGLNWETFKKLGIIQCPPLHVWLVKNEAERSKRVQELLLDKKKTIVFADSIEMGKMYSKRFNIPHVYGDTKQRLSKIKDNLVTLVSRVGDEGVSLPDIERVIEISWLHGSRRQELQRFTRLLHGKGSTGEGHIIMTAQEYQTDHKRLYGIMDKGFKIIIHREGISDKLIKQGRVERIYKRVTQQKTLPDSKIRTIEELGDPMLNLPGVKKMLTRCSGSELLVIKLLYKEKEKMFNTKAIALLLGWRDTHNVNLEKICKLGLIKKMGKGEYQADPTLKGALE